MAGSTATPTTSTTSPATASSATGGGGASATGGGATSAAAAAGGATALFPCLVYYPGSQNYSLIWVPMDGSNPIVSGANILGGSGAITIPNQVSGVIADCNSSERERERERDFYKRGTPTPLNSTCRVEAHFGFLERFPATILFLMT